MGRDDFAVNKFRRYIGNLHYNIYSIKHLKLNFQIGIIMKSDILKLPAFIIMLFICVNTHADTYNNITIKLGSFTLGDKNQTIDFTPVTFNTSSSTVYAVEYERKLRNNLSFGGELISYKNTFAPENSKANTTHIFANFKKYFDVTTHVHPFIGVGAGASTVRLTGGFSGSAGGFGIQFVAGVKFPFEEVSAVVEYKVISAEPADILGSTVDLSGDGLFAGIAINF